MSLMAAYAHARHRAVFAVLEHLGEAEKDLRDTPGPAGHYLGSSSSGQRPENPLAAEALFHPTAWPNHTDG
jgi:hypothetical protein